MDLEKSSITVHVFRTGFFSFAGDNHEIRAPLASGWADPNTNRVDLTIDADKLAVLDPNLSSEKRAEVQKRMLSADVLDANRFPQIKFSGRVLLPVGKNVHNKVEGTLSLHGQSRPITFHIDGPAEGYCSGEVTLKQTDFGIKPISIAGGTVKVKDEIKVEFEIVFR